MTRKQRRSVFIFGGLSVLALAVGLVLVALEDNIVFFYSPSDVVAQKVTTGQRFRLGGLVEDGSLKRGQGTEVEFSITDNAEVVRVKFDGLLPDLFREGQGVVTEGKIAPDGTFQADSVLAKHDENYMPPEVAATLKEKGVWKGKDEAEGEGAKKAY